MAGRIDTPSQTFVPAPPPDTVSGQTEFQQGNANFNSVAQTPGKVTYPDRAPGQAPIGAPAK